MEEPKYVIYQSESGKYRFKLMTKEGDVLVSSELYETRQGCTHAVKAFKKYSNSEVNDLTAHDREEKQNKSKTLQTELNDLRVQLNIDLSRLHDLEIEKAKCNLNLKLIPTKLKSDIEKTERKISQTEKLIERVEKQLATVN
jgi:uncharacterized protein YegP (UPF0339 family)